MIATLTGKISRLGLSDAILDVGGVGYLINLTTQTATKLSVGQDVKFHTAHIFREDSQSLFGFSSEEELNAFNMLCSVTGVGPKSALATLGSLGVDGLARAVTTADDTLFRAVPGIGPKTAKQIVLSLTGKLVATESTTIAVTQQVTNVVSALVGLGYLERTIRKTVELVATEEANLSDQELLKSVLAKLSNARSVGNDE